MDDNGEQVAERAAYNDLATTYDAKQRGTFHSARLGKELQKLIYREAQVWSQAKSRTRKFAVNGM